MTQDRMQLSELLEKAGADDIVREMIGFVAQRLMELDVGNRCGAGHGERTEARTNSRNGFRDRPWDTRAGTVALRDAIATESELRRNLAGFDNIRVFKGWIPERFQEVIGVDFKLVHVDVDLYQPTLDSLAFLSASCAWRCNCLG